MQRQSQEESLAASSLKELAAKQKSVTVQTGCEEGGASEALTPVLVVVAVVAVVLVVVGVMVVVEVAVVVLVLRRLGWQCPMVPLLLHAPSAPTSWAHVGADEADRKWTWSSRRRAAVN